MSDLFKDISGKITIISIAAFIFGSCIITYHLSLFQIQDFDLLKPHAIIVGFMYMLFLSFNIIFFAYRAGSKNDYSFNIYRIILGGILKLPIITLVVFYICEPNAIVNPEFKLYFLNYSYDVKTIAILCLLNTGLLFGYSSFMDDIKADEYLKKIKPILIIGPLISFSLLFLTYIRYSLFQSIFSIEIPICFGINFFIIAYRSAKLHDARIESEGKEKVNWSDDSYFNFGNTELGSIFNKIFFVLGISFILLKTTIDYSGKIFPNLPQSYGGGKLDRMSLVVGTDTFTGNKVYETKEYMFLAKEDSTILKLDWQEIKVILKTPINK